MSGQRWFGDKSRAVEQLAVRDLIVLPWQDVWFLWPVAEVRFADGGTHPYTVPLALVRPDRTRAAGFATWPDDDRVLIDAVQAQEFPAWLLNQLRQSARLAAETGVLVFAAAAELEAAASRVANNPIRAGGLEQSNTLIRYGDALVIKLFRRLHDGVNVDAEMGRFLYEEAGFRSIPAPLGEITWHATDGASVAVAFAQTFVPNLGDGWSWTLSEVAGGLSSNLATLRDGLTVTAFALLGRRTAEMHQALAARPDLADFAPEPVTSVQADAMATNLTEFLATTAALMREQRGQLPPTSAVLVDRFLAVVPELEARAAAFRAATGYPRIRVHGDYHLGQTLRTPDADWRLIDFEGEPARPLSERRAKYAAMKDVAGMTRSIGYARAVAARNAGAGSASPLGIALADWETAARRAFLRGYRQQIDLGPVTLAPRGDAAFAASLAAWELDKALYEIRYELGNRPDWLDVPIRGLLDPGR